MSSLTWSTYITIDASGVASSRQRFTQIFMSVCIFGLTFWLHLCIHVSCVLASIEDVFVQQLASSNHIERECYGQEISEIVDE